MSTQQSPRYRVHEVVRIAIHDPESPELHGALGTVHSCSTNPHGQYCYGVCVSETGICWDLLEEELQPAEQVLYAAVFEYPQA